MTRERAFAIISTEKTPREQGRELAKREVAYGEEHIKKWKTVDFSIFRDNFEDKWPEYELGFWEYVNAWRVINA
jgi:hypothetical protein|nr:MAG TPA: hypothetical protein [Caudoviricetes sp.]